MENTKIPSPARSDNIHITPRHNPRSRSIRSAGSPARSNGSLRLSNIVQQFQEANLSPVNTRRSVLSDNTEIAEPRRKSWWKNLDDRSRDVLEIFDQPGPNDVNDILEEYPDVERQPLMNQTIDLPESSGSESIGSIILPQRQLFLQKENRQQNAFTNIFAKEKLMAPLQKRQNDLNISVDIIHRNLFNHGIKQRNRPAFSSAFLNVSPNKTVPNKTKEMETVKPKQEVRTLFGNRPTAKRRNMFADLIVSESEDEIPEIQARVFAFNKNANQPLNRSHSVDARNHKDQFSPSSSIASDAGIASDAEINNWKLLPSSTMVEENLSDIRTPLKKAKLSKVSEHKESSINRSGSLSNTTKTKSYPSNKSFLRATEQQTLVKHVKIIERRNSKDHSFNDDYQANKSINSTITAKFPTDIHSLSKHSKETEATVQEKPVPRSKDDQLTNESKLEAHMADNEINSGNNQNIQRNDIITEDMNKNVTQVQDNGESEENKQVDDNESDNESNPNMKLVDNSGNYNDYYMEMEQVQDESDKENNEVVVQDDEREGESNAEIAQVDDAENYNNEHEIKNHHIIMEQIIEDDENVNEQEELENESNLSHENNNDENDQPSEQEQSDYDGDNMDVSIQDTDEINEMQNVDDNVVGYSEQENEEQYDEMERNIDNQEVEDSDNDNEENENVEQSLEQQSANESEQNNDDDQESEIDDESGNRDVEDFDSDHNDSNLTRNIENAEESIVNSPEAILLNRTDKRNTFNNDRFNTSTRMTKSVMYNATAKLNLTPDSSAEGSGWDSHRTTRKTLRQTLGKNNTPRKSMRALVMEKSAKQQTAAIDITDNIQGPNANSTEINPSTSEVQTVNQVQPETTPLVPVKTTQTSLHSWLEKIRENNFKRKQKIEEEMKKYLNSPSRYLSPNEDLRIRKTIPRVISSSNIVKPKLNAKPKPSAVKLGPLPKELLEELSYKPPKRYAPPNASWVTKRLYKYLEIRLEPKFEYKARLRAEKLVQFLFEFSKQIRKHNVAPKEAIDELKREMANLNIVRTHFEFYEFFHDFMPREIRNKVIPDTYNKLPLPAEGVFVNILKERT